jgi:hypothetical protein
MPPASARMDPLYPPPTTPHATRQSNGRGRARKLPFVSWEYSTMHKVYIAGEFWLRRRGEIPLLSQIKICNNILDPEALVVLYGDNSLGREVRISFILRIAIDFGYRHWNRTHASTAQNAACIWRGKPGMSNRNAKGIAGPHERRVLW